MSVLYNVKRFKKTNRQKPIVPIRCEYDTRRKPPVNACLLFSPDDEGRKEKKAQTNIWAENQRNSQIDMADQYSPSKTSSPMKNFWQQLTSENDTCSISTSPATNSATRSIATVGDVAGQQYKSSFFKNKINK